MTINDELLPCPFCGGDAMLTGGARGSANVFYVSCNSCNAIGEKFGSKFEDEVKQQARDAWNKRI